MREPFHEMESQGGMGLSGVAWGAEYFLPLRANSLLIAYLLSEASLVGSSAFCNPLLDAFTLPRLWIANCRVDALVAV